MKIAIIKVKSQEIPFDIDVDSKKFSGFVKAKSHNLVALDGTLQARLDLDCDRCGESFQQDFNESINLLISDGAYAGIDEDMNIVESFDGFVDIDEILESEISLIKSDYHYCDNCK